MILVIGEILLDVYPQYQRLGGAPFNFAYHLENLGFPVCFISRIGSDNGGQIITEKLKQYGFSMDTIQVDADKPTGTVRVRLDQKGIPDFNIVPNVAYDHIEYVPEKHLPFIHRAKLIYFGSLAQRTPFGFETIQTILSQRTPGTRCFYDINLRPNCYKDNIILQSLTQSNVLKLNQQELETLKNIIAFQSDDDGFVRYLLKTYPLECISLTKGEIGSALHTQKSVFRQSATTVDQSIDTVGAGDAYAAMLAVGILKGWPYEKMLDMAARFASRICEIKGAIPEPGPFYEFFKHRINNGE